MGGSSPTTVWPTAVITSDELNDALCHLYTKCLFSIIKEINKLLNCLNLSLYYIIMTHNIIFLHKHWKLQIPHFVFIVHVFYFDLYHLIWYKQTLICNISFIIITKHHSIGTWWLNKIQPKTTMSINKDNINHQTEAPYIKTKSQKQG